MSVAPARPAAPSAPARPTEESAFGVGALATGLFTTIPGLVLLYYLTDELGVTAAVAGLVVAAPKFLDLVINPTVGRLSDRTDTRWGPRRPWMAVGGLLFPLAFVAMFASPATGTGAALWVGVTFAAAGVAFSSFVVPWASLPADLGADARGRARMTAWRIGWLAVAILLAGGAAPVVTELVDGRSGYLLMATAMAALMVVAVVVAIAVGARRSTRRPPDPGENGSVGEFLRVLRADPALRSMYLVIVFCEVAAAGALASAPYIAEYVVGTDVPPLFVALILPLLLTMPLWQRAGSRFGKRPALIVAVSLFGVAALLMLTLPFLPPTPRFPVALGVLVVLGGGFAGMSMLPAAMLSDAVVHEAARSGRRRAGLLTGVSNAAETAGGGLGAGLYALVLGVSGFVSSTGTAVDQDATARFGIVGGVAVLAVLAVVGVVVALRRYTLTEAEVDEATSAATTGPG